MPVLVTMSVNVTTMSVDALVIVLVIKFAGVILINVIVYLGVVVTQNVLVTLTFVLA